MMWSSTWRGVAWRGVVAEAPLALLLIRRGGVVQAAGRAAGRRTGPGQRC